MDYYLQILDKLLNRQKLDQDEINMVIQKIRPIFLEESTILDIESPCYVIGDIHGQFFDLLNIFKIIKNDFDKRRLRKYDSQVFNSENYQNKNVFEANNPCSKDLHPTGNPELYLNNPHLTSLIKNYAPIPVNIICLGDYIDRGYNSIETLMFLFLYKIIFRRLYLLRGNHESKLLNGVYGFKDESLFKYDEALFIKMMNLFDLMSICAVVDSKYFLVHGGLGKINYKKLIKKYENSGDKIEKFHRRNRHTKVNYQETYNIDRNIAINSNILTPENSENKKEKNKYSYLLKEYFTCEAPDYYIDFLWSDPSEIGLEKNTRGLGYLFGKDIVEQFLNFFGLSNIIRSHQLVFEGYKSDFDGKLITVWSAPNYCYRMGNLGSILYINESFDFLVFSKAEPQY